MAKKPIKEVIHAKGIDIGIYTTDFEKEFISLTDIAKYKSSDPNDTIKNWRGERSQLDDVLVIGVKFKTENIIE